MIIVKLGVVDRKMKICHICYVTEKGCFLDGEKKKNIKCNACNMIYHTRCDGVNDETYKKYKENKDWVCSKCRQQGQSFSY